MSLFEAGNEEQKNNVRQKVCQIFTNTSHIDPGCEFLRKIRRTPPKCRLQCLKLRCAERIAEKGDPKVVYRLFKDIIIDETIF